MPPRLPRTPLTRFFKRIGDTMAPSLNLDSRERLLKDCLVDCSQTVPPLEIRFAGGWVRDKLLGLQSNDIDAALSTLSGKDFGQIFLQFYEKHGAKYKEEAKRLGIGNTSLNKIVLVEEDAEKSKHLAVAKMKLFGLEVDLVNLRTEVYASDSRTPFMKMGTAEEDALRRDATINALFYNIHTEEIEDFTGKGLEDMQNKIMRTPLEPYQTFNDDPLRVLRLIRFAARLGYDIDPATQEAMKAPSIHEALKLKISRERVRTEIVKALSGSTPGPARALSYIYKLDLFAACFANPGDSSPPSVPDIPQLSSFLYTQVLANTSLFGALQLGQEDSYIPWLLLAYTPWAAFPSSHGSKAIKEGLKATAREAKLLVSSITNRRDISAFVSDISRSEKLLNRGTIGMALRRWGPSWGLQVLYALLVDPNALPAFKKFLQRLVELDLDGTKALDAKPLFDGRKIKEVLDKQRDGRGNQYAADLVMEWQLNYPERDAGECAKMLWGRRDEILARDVPRRPEKP
jgi:tRNA nucleotidyltransferase (CCA-adding enzyme)